MNCYNCGCTLSEHDFCTACKADVKLYKRIISISNRLYNEGLEKAKVRDLSGAEESLRQSLKFNKNNMDARNLLGLVYFESGEVVAALSEWIISKNLAPEKNLAEVYINTIQSNPGKLEELNSSIKKYNLAFVQCNQDGKDMAVIQLKKTININPKFIRAHKLLALLYMDREDWESAKREIDRCLEIDHNDTQCLKYKAYVDSLLTPDETEKVLTHKKKEVSRRYKSDNQDIIEPVGNNTSIRGAVAMVINILVGIIIGVAALYVLVIPQVENDAAEKANIQAAELGEVIDSKNLEIQGLEVDMKLKDNEISLLKDDLAIYEAEEGMIARMNELMDAGASYIKAQDVYQTAEDLNNIRGKVDPDTLSESYRNLYTALVEGVSPKLSATYYDLAYNAYSAGDYELAITNFQLAFEYDNANVDALYYLAGSYKRVNMSEEAVETYQRVIDLFPDTQRAKKAEELIQQETS